MGSASVDHSRDVLPLVVDTGTVLTAYDDGSGMVRAHTGDFRVFGIDAQGRAIPRIDFSNIQLFTTSLGMLGVEGVIPPTPVSGVLGGDNLSRFAVAFDYRAAQPTMTVVENIQPCNCEFEPRVEQPDACDAVLPFSLAGGNDTTLQSQTRIIIGNDQYTYPPTRVLLDACVEPLPDPLTTIVPGDPSYVECVDDSALSCEAGQGDQCNCPFQQSGDRCFCPHDEGDCVCPKPQYMPSGVDVRMIVASGFPGLALSTGAYARLRGQPATDALFAGPTVTLRLPDGADAGGVQAAVTTLGRLPSGSDAGASALALVSREKYYGPCVSLSRSRRQRRAGATAKKPSGCLLNNLHTCQPDVSSFIVACNKTLSNSQVCNDDGTNSSVVGRDSPTPAVIEMTTQLPVYVIRDLTPLLVGINADVRPSESTVEGIIGTEVLKRLVATVDYPGSRFIARCTGTDDCKAYSRLSVPTTAPATLGDCDFCANNAISHDRPATALQPCPVAR